MNIGKRLRELRVAKGMSQGDVECRTRLMRCYVSRVEGGFTVPTLATLEKFAEALDVEPYELIFQGNGAPSAPKVRAHNPLSQHAKKLMEIYKGMSSADRITLLTLAAKFAKS